MRREQPLCPCPRTPPHGWDELDHDIPLEHGGTNHRSNLVGLCTRAHRDKTAKQMGYKRPGADADGHPTNPDHHWNQT